MLESGSLSVVEKNHDQAGLASWFRNEAPKLEAVPTFEAQSLTLEAFCNNYVNKNSPVLLKGALSSEWGCMNSWSVEYLKQTVGHVELPVRVNPSSDGTFGDVERLDGQTVSLYDFDALHFSEFLDSLQDTSPRYYPARLELCEQLPELVPDVPSFYDIPWRFAFGLPYKNGATLYFGPGQQTTPLHYDTLENLTFMIAGSKTFKLYPPSESHLMSPAPRCLGTHYSVDTPKAVEAGNPVCLEVTLNRGDMLYLPNCWWHAVHGGDGFNISLNYWFCQHRDKEDYAAYQSYLRAAFDRTLAQLHSMQLPHSVLEEAEKDAELSIESKMNERKQFDWTKLK